MRNQPVGSLVSSSTACQSPAADGRPALSAALDQASGNSAAKTSAIIKRTVLAGTNLIRIIRAPTVSDTVAALPKKKTAGKRGQAHAMPSRGRKFTPQLGMRPYDTAR